MKSSKKQNSLDKGMVSLLKDIFQDDIDYRRALKDVNNAHQFYYKENLEDNYDYNFEDDN